VIFKQEAGAPFALIISMNHPATDNRRRLLTALAALLTATLPTLGAGTDTRVIESVGSIEAAAHSYIKSLVPAGAAETHITVQPIDTRLRLAKCGSALTAQLPPGSNLTARATVAVTCAGPTHWTVYVPVVVESRISVLVLRHAVARDARLGVDDVTIDLRRTAGTAAAYLSSVAELAGRTVRRPLPLGTALTVEMFAADLVIHRGQEVTLLAGGPDIEIRATGRALMDGPTGARIQVQNLSSMTVVEGVVESSDVVRVAL
jgi:flagella basal body P-ring formation protein FlgA